jgi:curli biogenesis system outer membrane secretion channel CsgG
VASFDNKTPRQYSTQELEAGMADMFVTELYKTGRFNVLEREQMEEVLKEQELSLTGLMEGGEDAEMLGNLLNVEYIIVGAVTEFGTGSSGIGVSAVKVNAHTVRTVADVRLIDVRTGKVITTASAAGEETAFGLTLRDPDALYRAIDFGSEDFDETTVGKSIRKCMKSLAESLVDKYSDIPLEGQVIKADPKEVYINLGDTSGIYEGMRFRVMRRGEQLVDPATGEELGSEEDIDLGVIEVVTVREKYAICKRVKGEGLIQTSDEVSEIK